MNLDWKVVANEPWIWICGAIICAIALYQCTYFMVRALRIMSRSGLQRSEIGSIVRSAVITSFGPVMAELFVMIALVVALSAGFAWQREGAAVGSVVTELVQASNAAAGAGQEFGGKNFDMIGFANVVFVMNVSCIGWLIVAGLFTRYLGVARQKIAGGDSHWLSILTHLRHPRGLRLLDLHQSDQDDQSEGCALRCGHRCRRPALHFLLQVGRLDQDPTPQGVGAGHCHVRRNDHRQAGRRLRGETKWPIELNFKTSIPQVYEKEFSQPIHRVGSITCLLAILGMFLPPLWLYLQYGVFPPTKAILVGMGMALTYAAPFFIIEPISYYPTLGDAGTYMSFLAGNIANMRLPCAAVAQSVSGVEEGTKKGELIATVGIAISIWLSIIAVFIGAVATGWIVTTFPPPVQDAFKRFLAAGGLRGSVRPVRPAWIQIRTGGFDLGPGSPVPEMARLHCNSLGGVRHHLVRPTHSTAQARRRRRKAKEDPEDRKGENGWELT